MSGPAQQRAPRPRALWIGDATPAFGMYHAPAASVPVRPSVLFCAPFGWEDMGSYPIRRSWACQLAEAGHPVLRFDLPGTGQSAGAPADNALVATWLHAVAEAAAWLRHEQPVAGLAAIGIGLGALLALQATAEGAAIDELVLWGMPAHGRALTRRLRAFAGLQTSTVDGEDELPPGWLQSGGYVLSAETLADLSALRPDGARVGALRRALLLDEDGTPFPPALAAGLRAAGVEVEASPGVGYAEMLDSPERSVLPRSTIATVGDWLARSGGARADAGPAPTARDELVLLHDGVRVRERTFVVERPSGMLFGVLAQPADDEDGDVALVCLPAWAERCNGPNRSWVEAARRYAARGVPVLRTDLASIGDSDGPRAAMADLSSVWDGDRIAQVRDVLDALEDRGHGTRFLLLGLCSGAYWAQEATAADPRVVGLAALNPGVSEAGRDRIDGGQARKALLVFQPSWWRLVARGEVSIHGVATVGAALRGRLQLALRGRRGSRRAAAAATGGADGHSGTAIAVLLQRLAERGGRAAIGFSAGEAGYRLLEAEGIARHPERWPALRLERFASTDHNLRTVRDQLASRALVDELVEGATTGILDGWLTRRQTLP